MNSNCCQNNIEKMYLLVPKDLNEVFIITDKENSSGILVSGKLISILSKYSVGILIEHFTSKQSKTISEHVYPEFLQGLTSWIREITDDNILGISDTAPKRSRKVCKYSANTPLPYRYEGKYMRFMVHGCFETISVNDKNVYILTLNDSFKKYGDFLDLNKFISVSNYGTFGTTLYPMQKASFIGASCSACGDCAICGSCSSCLLCDEVNLAAGLVSFSSLLRSISVSRSSSAFISGRDVKN